MARKKTAVPSVPRTTRSGAPLDVPDQPLSAVPAESVEPPAYIDQIRVAIVTEMAPKGSSLASIRKTVVGAVGAEYDNSALVLALKSGVDDGTLTLSNGGYKLGAPKGKQKGAKKKAKAKAKVKRVPKEAIQMKIASLDGVTVALQIPWNACVRDLKDAYFEARQLEPDSVSLSLFGAPGNEDAIPDKQLVSKVTLPESRTLFMLQGLRGVKELKKQLAALETRCNDEASAQQRVFSEKMDVIRKQQLIEWKGTTARHAKVIDPLDKKLSRLHKKQDAERTSLYKKHERSPKSQHALFLFAEQTGEMDARHEHDGKELTDKLQEACQIQATECKSHDAKSYAETMPLHTKHSEEMNSLRVQFEEERAELNALLTQAVLRAQESEGLFACPGCDEKDQELKMCAGACGRQLCTPCRKYWCSDCEEGGNVAELFCEQCNVTEECDQCEQPLCPGCLEEHSCGFNFGGCTCGMCGFF
jgi:hypothetical protein